MSLLLDCTLRDGGYYTHWDFPKELKELYFRTSSRLPIDYLEIGYRNPTYNEEYQGEFFYTPTSTLQEIKSLTNSKLAILIDAKSVSLEKLRELLLPIQGVVDMVRVAVNPNEVDKVVDKISLIKEMGFTTCLNIMYLSTWERIPGFFSSLAVFDDLVDFLYLVDSFGSVFPDQLERIIHKVKLNSSCKLGFHGHNNLELAFANSLRARECGVDIIDATFTGMGRGAGNLKTELWLTYLSAHLDKEIDMDALASLVQGFENLQTHYGWGTNLPYMISGANSLPQKEVMEWVSRRFYSYNSIVQALNNQKSGIKDNATFPEFSPQKKSKRVVIIGGGPTVQEHASAILKWVEMQADISIIHASSKNSGIFKDLALPQYFCLVGNEGKRMEKVFEDLGDFKGQCILPPFPRRMGTYVPEAVRKNSFQLPNIAFTSELWDSHTVLALATAFKLEAESIYLAGYDGYLGASSSPTEKELTNENEASFRKFIEFSGINLQAITATAYQTLNKSSLFAGL